MQSSLISVRSFVALFEGWKETEKARVEARKLTDTDPSEEQKMAGNYAKGKFWWNAMEISIENPKGSVRRGKNKKGIEWETKMCFADYGYIRRTKSEADKDHVDVFIGDKLDSQIVFVIDQNNQAGKFDEAKVMIGFTNEKEAKDAYMGSYQSNWDGFRNITPVTLDEFKHWLKCGDTSKPYKTPESWSV